MSAIAFDPLIAEAKERARRRRLGVVLAIALAVTLALVLALRSPTGAGGVRSFHIEGISATIPAGWFVTHRPLMNVSWPVQRFVVSSFPVTYDLRTADASYLPPQTGVLAQIVEEWVPISGEHWPARPVHLRLGQLGKMKLYGGNRWTELLFRLHGRHFYAFVWIGRRAPASETRQLQSILEGMRAAAKP